MARPADRFWHRATAWCCWQRMCFPDTFLAAVFCTQTHVGIRQREWPRAASRQGMCREALRHTQTMLRARIVYLWGLMLEYQLDRDVISSAEFRAGGGAIRYDQHITRYCETQWSLLSWPFFPLGFSSASFSDWPGIKQSRIASRFEAVIGATPLFGVVLKVERSSKSRNRWLVAKVDRGLQSPEPLRSCRL